MLWAQTQWQAFMPWQQSGEFVWWVWDEPSEAGEGTVAAPAAWQCVPPVLVDIPAWTEAIAGPAVSNAVNCQSSTTAITDFSRGRHFPIGASLSHRRRVAQP